MQRHWIWIIPFICALWACAGGGINHNVGRLTKPESRVAVESGGPHEAQWQTLDVAIIFDYQWKTLMATDRKAGDTLPPRWEPDRFDMTGRIELQKRVKEFTVLDYLRVRVHFLDAEGVILSTHHLWSAGYRGNMHYGFVNFNFSKQYPIPAGAEMIAFSYTGQASDGGGRGYSRGGGGDRIDWDFWWRP